MDVEIVAVAMAYAGLIRVTQVVNIGETLSVID